MIVRALALFGTLGLVACDDPASGRVAARVYGERFVEEGMPAKLFHDGWSLRFDRFLVSIGDVRAQAGNDRVGATGYRIYDLARPSAGSGHELAVLAAPDATYDRFLYTIAPSATAEAGNATAADVAAMRAAGASVRIRATATKGSETRRLDLAFSTTLAHDCAIEGKIADSRLDVRATLHVDHLLMDNTPESNLRLQLLVDADGGDGSAPDGTITTQELAATEIHANPDYRVLSTRDFAGNPIRNLGQYIERRVGSIGHVDGENPCTITGSSPAQVVGDADARSGTAGRS